MTESDVRSSFLLLSPEWECSRLNESLRQKRASEVAVMPGGKK